MIVNYINGNYLVTTLYNGGRRKRALRGGEELCPKFPDSIDLKITNSCSQGCPFCHENSVPGGKNFNLVNTKNILSSLPRVGIEIAIGGGNIFDCSKDALSLVEWMKEQGFQPRLTISYEEFIKRIKDFQLARWEKAKTDEGRLIKEIEYFGISTTKYHSNIPYISKNIVWHVIVGITPIEEVIKMFDDPVLYKKILFLGFKQFGRALNMEIPNLPEWREFIKSTLLGHKVDATIGFDNLALEQLEIKNYLDKDVWESFWLGQEFSSSMYVDAVEETFAPTSRSLCRTSWKSISLIDYFNKNKNAFSD